MDYVKGFKGFYPSKSSFHNLLILKKYKVYHFIHFLFLRLLPFSKDFFFLKNKTKTMIINKPAIKE